MNPLPANLRQAWHRAALRTAGIAAVFCLLVCLGLFINTAYSTTHELITAGQVHHLKAELADRVTERAKLASSAPAQAEEMQAGEEQLKLRIRRLDLLTRKSYFQRRSFAGQGAILLLLGVVVFLIAVKGMKELEKKLPRPDPAVDPAEELQQVPPRGRLAVMVIGLLSGVLLLATALLSRHDITGQYAGAFAPAGKAPAGNYYPSDEEIARQWPAFRGPQSGAAPEATPPAKWDGAGGEGVLWKTPIPLPGFNSPVVWGNRVYLAGADAAKREVYCLDADTGKLLWTRAVAPGSTAKLESIPEDTGYAAPTLVTDGQRVFAIFATGDIAGFAADGNPLWSHNLGVPASMYGYASSLTMYRNRVIVQYDQGSTPEEGKSALYALDAASGKTVWQVKRPVPGSWSSPIVITAGKQAQLITCANPWVIAYNPQNGKELWRAECLGGDVAPSPVFAGGMVFAANTGANLAAIRPDGTGNVTKSHVAWLAGDGLPDTTSPVSDGVNLFLLDSYGYLTCYDAKSGEKRWEQTLEGEFRASPIIADKQLYILDRQGLMYIVEYDPAFKVVAKCPLGESADATPAFLGGRIYIRGKANLYCIGQ